MGAYALRVPYQEIGTIELCDNTEEQPSFERIKNFSEKVKVALVKKT